MTTGRRTALYWIHGYADELIYVGIGFSPIVRWASHERKSWWNEVTRVRVEWFDARDDARAAELCAIATHRPRYNIRDKPSVIPDEARRSIREAVAEYAAAEPARNAGLRALRDEYGLEQKDVIEITGYTRETVRFALMSPEQWLTAKEARRKRRPKD